MKIFSNLKMILLSIIRSPKTLIDLIRSVIVELRRVEWLSLGNLTKTVLQTLFYGALIGILIYAVDRLFEFLIIEKILNLSK